MNVNDRIKKIREEFCDGSNKEFAERLKVGTQYASNITKPGKNVGDKLMSTILEAFPAVNPVWLKMGEGEMLKDAAPAPRAVATQLELDFTAIVDSNNKIADAVQTIARSNEKLADTNGKMYEDNHELIKQIAASLSRLEEKIDKKGDAASSSRVV